MTKAVKQMGKWALAYELYAIHDYCMTGYSVDEIKKLPRHELERRVLEERHDTHSALAPATYLRR